MWLGIGITIVIILLITILIAVCEVWCILDDIRTNQINISEKVNIIISDINELEKWHKYFMLKDIQKDDNLGVAQ